MSATKFIYLIALLSLCLHTDCLAVPKNKLFQSNKADLRYLKDSLANNKVDTIICFYEGCATCLCGVNEITYVIWVKNGIFYLASPYRFETGKKHRKKIPEYCVQYGKPIYLGDFAWIKQIAELAKNEQLNEGQLKTLSHSFIELTIKIGDFQYNSSISDYERLANIDKYHSIIIDKFLLWLHKLRLQNIISSPRATIHNRIEYYN